MHLLCCCHVVAMHLLCIFHAYARHLQCSCHALAVLLSCICHVLAMHLLCIRHAISNGFAMRLQWVCYKLAMHLQCISNAYAVAMHLLSYLEAGRRVKVGKMGRASRAYSTSSSTQQTPFKDKVLQTPLVLKAFLDMPEQHNNRLGLPATATEPKKFAAASLAARHLAWLMLHRPYLRLRTNRASRTSRRSSRLENMPATNSAVEVIYTNPEWLPDYMKRHDSSSAGENVAHLL